jgi:uncharacterized protein
MLQVDVRELRRGGVETQAELDAADPLFEGLEVPLEGPLSVDGLLEPAGEGAFFWHARLEGQVKSTCRRCLAEFTSPVVQAVEVMFSTDPELLDDPSVYPLVEPLARVDLRPAVREELALAVDAFPLCREDCRGLCPRCGADLNRGACQCSAPSA